MQRRTAELAEVTSRLLGDLGYELVELKLIPRGRALHVQLLIDHLERQAGISVGDCARVSKALGAEPAFGELIPERHILEVSSPGVNRPLTRPAHYRRFRGELVVIRLAHAREGRRSHTGMIVDVSDEHVTIVEEVEGERQTIPFAEIASAHLKVDPWKRTETHSIEP